LAPTPHDLASQRVEHALRRFEHSWRSGATVLISHDLDELDVAVELWLDTHEAAEPEESVR
jgi:hypothetical protein